jgi:hypothetical protein
VRETRTRRGLFLGIVAAAAIALALGLRGRRSGDAPVALVRDAAGAVTLRDGTLVRGVTWTGGPFDERRWDADLARAKKLGANAIRTFSFDEDSPRLLDLAARHGLKVLQGIWLRHGAPGMEGDDRFDWVADAAGRDVQWRDAERAVLAVKDHPALLAWALGNEVLFNTPAPEAKLAHVRFLEALAARVKALDPAHPVTCVTAWVHDLDYVIANCPSLDFHGINTYGDRDTSKIPAELARLGAKRPYLVTELGPRGWWEVEPDPRGVKLDPPEDEKRAFIVRTWREQIEARRGPCLGAFVFHFGDDADPTHTGTWLGLRSQGLFRPECFGLAEAFGGEPPAPEPPRIARFAPGKPAGAPGEWLPVALDVEGARGPLAVRFACHEPRGPRFYRDRVHPLRSRRGERGYEVELPAHVTATAGVKLYAFVADGASLAVAAASVAVEGTPPARAGILAALPLVLYDEDAEPPHGFVASGFMGDQAALTLDLRSREAARTGRFGIRLRYGAAAGWAGVAWQRPSGDWGEEPWAADLRGARRLVFWARGARGGERISVALGLIGPERPFPDSARLAPRDFTLGTTWARCEVDLAGADLSRVKTPFAISVPGQGAPVEVDLDDIAIE